MVSWWFALLMEYLSACFRIYFGVWGRLHRYVPYSNSSRKVSLMLSLLFLLDRPFLLLSDGSWGSLPVIYRLRGWLHHAQLSRCVLSHSCGVENIPDGFAVWMQIGMTSLATLPPWRVHVGLGLARHCVCHHSSNLWVRWIVLVHLSESWLSA